MVWVITIAVFLATVVAALLVFLIYSQKEQIEKALKEKRKEERTKLEIEVELATPHEPPIYEKSTTKNTSRRGARIVSSERWQPQNSWLNADFSTLAVEKFLWFWMTALPFLRHSLCFKNLRLGHLGAKLCNG